LQPTCSTKLRWEGERVEIGYAFAVHATNSASGAVTVRAISAFFICLSPSHKTLKSGFGFKLSEYGWGSAIIGKIKGATSGQHHELATSLLRQSSSQHRQAGRAVSPLGELSLRRLG